MGIRYYAYAFDADLAHQVESDPWSVVSIDPLADAWGFEPHAMMAYPTFEQTTSKRDLLYLDKAWRDLQVVTRPPTDGHSDGAAHRMFDGQVTWSGEGYAPVDQDDPSERDTGHPRRSLSSRRRAHPRSYPQTRGHAG